MLKKRLGKKGDTETVLLILQPIVAIILFVALSAWIYNIQQSTFMEQRYYLRDIPLTVSAVYAAPAKFYYSYESKELGLFDYTFEGNNFSVEIADSKLTYPYGADKNYLNLSKEISGPQRLDFSNYGREVRLQDGFKFSQKVKYGYLKTTERNWFEKKIILAGDSLIIQKLAKEAKSGFITQSAEPDIYFKLEEPEGNNLTAYIAFATAEKSRKLASIAINHLVEKNPGVGQVRIYLTEEMPAVKEAGVIMQKGRDIKLEVGDLEKIFGEYYG